MKKKAKLLAVASVCGLVVTVLGASSAQADPSGPPQYRQLAGVGSDVTSGVMDAMSNLITVNGTKVLGSYDATGSTTIQTQPAAACVINRPNGSNPGRTALLSSLANNDGCLQYARSSNLTTSATGGAQLTYVPFALDAVTFAVTANSIVPRELTLAQLQAIYTCNPTFVGTGPNWTIQPMLPQPGSGTRSFWETEMGITDAAVVANNFPCITDMSGGSLIEQDNGTVLGQNNLIPFPISSWDAEESQTIGDVRGNSVLGVINGVASQGINPNFQVTREVYNVIPTANQGTAPTSTVFVGPNSLICQNTATIEQYGFSVDPNCGSTSAVTSQ